MTDPVQTPEPAAEGATPPNPAPTPAPAPDADAPLGEGGLRALQAERAAREAAERSAREAAERLAKLDPLLAVLGGTADGDPKSDLDRLNERLAAHETELAAERQARWRAEVAAEKGLTAAQIKRLQGNTREELLADADDLLAAFPAAPPPPPGTPRPDPSQGGRGTGGAPSLDAQIAEAQKNGDIAKAMSLTNQKLAELAGH